MKYKLINSVTKIETICDKLTIDGFDYYVSDESIKQGSYWFDGTNIRKDYSLHLISGFDRKVIATTNPNIDVPKVIDEVEELSEKFIGCKYEDIEDNIDQIGYDSFIRGYNQALEDNKEKKYTEEDMKVAITQAFLSGVERLEDFERVQEMILDNVKPKTEWEVKFVDGKLKLKYEND